MRYKFLKNILPRSFNKRNLNKYQFVLKNKYPINLMTKKQIRFEFIYFKLLKLIFKKTFKYKYTIFKKFAFFFNLTPNYPLSLKGKNSRMGKGVGKFLRWSFFLKANSIIFSFASFYLKRFFFFLKILKKRISSKLFLVEFFDNY